jgi:sugar lactone lactonase YvrE
MRLHSRRFAGIAFALAGLVSPGVATAFDFGAPPPVLDPKTYVSPSGRFTLLVDPSAMEGRGRATYRLSQDGREVWRAEKPFSLWNARVTDDGVVGGYAYTEGFQGSRIPGDFHVVLLAGDGSVRLDEVTKRAGRSSYNRAPNPVGAGIVMNADNDRLVIRLEDQIESWWVYQISTGERLAALRPYERMPDSRPMKSRDPEKHIAGVIPVAKTPLMLLKWRCTDMERGEESGAKFSLIDPDAQPVWTLDLPKDGEIAATPPGDGHFALIDHSTKQRVEFSAHRGADGKWVIAELRREPAPRTVDASPPPAIPNRPLRHLGRIELRGPDRGAPSPIQGVREFAFDGRGRLAVLGGNERARTLMLVDPSGKVVGSLPLDTTRPDEGEIEFKFAGVGGDRFVVIKTRYLQLTHIAEAWWADFGTGKTTPIVGFDRSDVGYVAGFPDGGFVVGAWVCDDGITAFDAQGKRTWSQRADYNAKPRDLLPGSPKALTITTTGEVVALENNTKAVYRFDRNGRHLGTIDLAKAWGRTPNYPTGIDADTDGGFIITDFNGSPPIVRMKRDGTVRAAFHPKHADGRVTSGEGVKAAPDGRLWTSDGHALLRLDDAGVVDRILGDAPTPAGLGEIAGVEIDRAGRIYAVDERTGSVHVFDPQGRWLRVCLPKPTDFEGRCIFPQVTVSDEGHVYFNIGGTASRRIGDFLHFSDHGDRVGVERLALDDISQEMYLQPGTGHRWVVGYHKVFLVDRAGKVLKTIERCPDGRWLELPRAAAVSPDGSLAVIARGAVHFYAATGEPIRTVPLPDPLKGTFASIAYDGNRVAIVEDKVVTLLDSSGRPQQRFSPVEQGDEPPAGPPFLAAGGRELLLFDGQRTIIRYELP